MTFRGALSAALMLAATPILTAMNGSPSGAVEVVRRVERVPATPMGTVRASWYGADFAGRPTASGEIFDPEQLTAAHPSLPFGSKVRVTNPANGRTVVVRINDRGPFVAGRALDLSAAAAARLDLIGAGVAPVALELLRP